MSVTTALATVVVQPPPERPSIATCLSGHTRSRQLKVKCSQTAQRVVVGGVLTAEGFCVGGDESDGLDEVPHGVVALELPLLEPLMRTRVAVLIRLGPTTPHAVMCSQRALPMHA